MSLITTQSARLTAVPSNSNGRFVVWRAAGRAAGGPTAGAPGSRILPSRRPFARSARTGR